MVPSRRVLVVEDDDNVAAALEDALRLNRYATRRESTVAGAVEQALTGWPDLVLLDLGLPDGDGLRACRSIRETSGVPIIVVSARGSEHLKVECLRAGADDYVTKPFGPRELLARMEAVLRRVPHVPETPAPGALWSIGDDASLDVGAMRLTVAGRVHELTRKELDLLVVLVEAGGQVVPREELGARVWQGTWVEQSRTLDVHVAGLRTKLGRRESIQTVRGVGVRLGVRAERVR